MANTPSITATGINAGDTVITNVASAGDITDTANANNAATAGDVNAAVSGATAAGLNFAGDSGTNVNRPLGSIFNITGGETDPANLTTGNISVVANGTNGLSIQLAEAIDLGDDGSIKTGNTVTNSDGVAITDGTNVTTMTSAGTKVIDGTNTSNYGANGLTQLMLLVTTVFQSIKQV